MNAIGQRENLATSGSAFTEESSTQWQYDYSSTYQGSHYPSYDGNGNVTEYLDEGGVLIAHYEYDPFGNITRSSRAPVVISEGEDSGEGFFIRENSGDLFHFFKMFNSSTVPREGTNVFSYRFSTKPQDEITGLYYYGYRYYDPVTGRWPSRDPIEEAGGLNLYGIVGNDPLNYWDYLGLDRPEGNAFENFVRDVSEAIYKGFTGESFDWSKEPVDLTKELKGLPADIIDASEKAVEETITNALGEGEASELVSTLINDGPNPKNLVKNATKEIIKTLAEDAVDLELRKIRDKANKDECK